MQFVRYMGHYLYEGYFPANPLPAILRGFLPRGFENMFHDYLLEGLVPSPFPKVLVTMLASLATRSFVWCLDLGSACWGVWAMSSTCNNNARPH